MVGCEGIQTLKVKREQSTDRGVGEGVEGGAFIITLQCVQRY